MIEIKGKYNEAKIFTDVVDSASIAQVQELCNQEFTAGSRIRLMPDIHAGAGCTIGTTMTITDKVVPNLVGVDIGCGMETTRIREGRLELQKLDKLIYEKIPSGFSIRDKAHRYPELKMLTDAVASSKIISAKKSEELVQKLCRLTSTHQAEQLRQLASLSSRVKPDNEQVYYIIDAIQTAILEKRQIQFQYYEYTPEKKRVLKHGGYLYQLDPYALEWKNDHYYLIGFSHKHQRMAHFRVDRLSGIKILPSGFTPDEDFDVAGYTNKIVDMFAADRTVSVELLCENKLMKTIIDHYGEAVPTRTYDEEHFTANIEVDPSGTFYGWVFKFMGGIQIIAPHECVEEMKRIAHRFL